MAAMKPSINPNLPPSSHSTASSTLDPAEIARFERMAAEWWDANGKFRPLHKLGPARLTFVRDEILAHYGRPAGGLRPLKGLTLLDIGCGGGLMSEPLARLGAQVTGLDPGRENIEAARRHAEGQGLGIDYRVGLVEDLAGAGEQFDVVSCLEVVEHVPDVPAFLTACAQVLKPGGLMLLSTINRTLKSYALAIVGAEYILRWLPVGTHQWDRFVTPAELAAHVATAGLAQPRFKGMAYNPLTDAWFLTDDTDVNYLAAAGKP